MHNVLGYNGIKDDYMNYLANGMFISEQMKAPINKLHNYYNFRVVC